MNQSAHNIMSSQLVTVPAGTSASEALNLMQEKGIRHLPVINQLSEIMGIVSQNDLGTNHSPVESFIKAPVEYLEQTTSLRGILLKMLEKRISCVLVLGSDKEKIIGIITTDDILWYFASLLDNNTNKKRSLWDIVNLQTIGDVIRSLSDIGI